MSPPTHIDLALCHGHALVYLRTDAGELVYVSTRAATFLGAEAERFVGRRWSSLFAEGSVNTLRREQLRTAHGRGELSPRVEVEWLAERPTPLWVELHESRLPETTTEGAALIVGTAIDITERKLREGQLQDAQRLENLGLLAAGIAHDLNNILSPILIAGSLMGPLARDDRHRRMVEILQASAERGSRIVRQILGFAQGGEGGRGPLDPKHVVREVILVVSETFPRNIELQDNIAPDLRSIHANPTQIQQLLLNLCINARDAMPRGGALELSVANCDLDHPPAHVVASHGHRRWVRFQVRDTGVGIPPEKLEQIWVPFFTTKPRGRGTGLGLSTVRGLVVAHGGFVEVHSEPGVGTTFTVFLPAVDALPAGAEAGSTDTPGRTPTGHGERILVVDDEPALRAMIAATLGPHGYEVLLAADGVEALATVNVRGEDLSLIITDVHMPHMTGDVLVNVVKRLHPNLPVLAISGHPDVSQSWTAEGQLQPDASLAKPFTAHALLNLVNQLIPKPAA